MLKDSDNIPVKFSDETIFYTKCCIFQIKQLNTLKWHFQNKE